MLGPNGETEGGAGPLLGLPELPPLPRYGFCLTADRFGEGGTKTLQSEASRPRPYPGVCARESGLGGIGKVPTQPAT